MHKDKIGRRIPKRTLIWKLNISKALDKKITKVCQRCKKEFRCHRYRVDSAKYCSVRCRVLVSKGKEIKSAQKEKIKYAGIHMWVARYLEATNCEQCGATGYLNRANISGEYKRDLTDWKVLCVPCHSEFDGVSKIPRKDEPKLLELREKGLTFNEIAKQYGVTRKAISKRYYKAKKLRDG